MAMGTLQTVETPPPARSDGDGGLQRFAEFAMALEAVAAVPDESLPALAEAFAGPAPAPPPHLRSPVLRRAFVAVVAGLDTLRAGAGKGPADRAARAASMRALLERARALADRAEFELAPDAQERADRARPRAD